MKQFLLIAALVLIVASFFVLSPEFSLPEKETIMDSKIEKTATSSAPDPKMECLLRRGSPAKNFAKAKVIWLPNQTLKIGVSEIPKNDVAILKITELIDGSALPENFEYFGVNKNYVPKVGEKLYSINYPSEFLGADLAVTNMNLVFTLGD